MQQVELDVIYPGEFAPGSIGYILYTDIPYWNCTLRYKAHLIQSMFPDSRIWSPDKEIIHWVLAGDHPDLARAEKLAESLQQREMPNALLYQHFVKQEAIINWQKLSLRERMVHLERMFCSIFAARRLEPPAELYDYFSG